MQKFFLDNKVKITAGSAKIVVECYHLVTHLVSWEPARTSSYWIFMHQYMGTKWNDKCTILDRMGLMK